MRAIVSRFLFFFFTVWLILTVAFLCIYWLPGDPARMILGRQASDEAIRSFRESAGLQEPLWVRYTMFTQRTLRLQLGDSLLYRRPVAELLADRSLITIHLVAFSAIVVVMLAFIAPVGLRLIGLERFQPRLESLLALGGIAPPYVLGVFALLVFAGWLGWVSVIFDGSRVRDWVLPALVLAAYPSAIVMRLFGCQLEAVLNAPYILRARAMGFATNRVIIWEAVPNALTAALPGFANALAAFITGTFFVEVIFGIPGLGRLTYEAISNKDIALLSGLCILFAVAVSGISTALEVLRVAIDPRLRSRHA